jgi:hypothetical protein
MTKSKKVQKVAKKVEKTQTPEEKRRQLLADALHVPVESIYSAEESKKQTEALYQKTLKDIKNKPAPSHTPLPINEDIKEEIIEEELEIVEVPPVKGKKVLSQNSSQAQKLIKAKEAANLKELQESIAADQARTAAKEAANKTKANGKNKKEEVKPTKLTPKEISAKALAAKRAKKALLESQEVVKEVAPIVRTRKPVSLVTPKGEVVKVIPEDMSGKELKRLNKKENKGKKANKATSTGTKTKFATPLSKMTIAELEEIKGSIADVQWNKYYKMAGGTSGAIKVSKPAEKKTKAPIVAAVESKEVTPIVRTRKTVEKVTTFKLADVPLDELIAELKRRGCKGSIRVCTEVEL